MRSLSSPGLLRRSLAVRGLGAVATLLSASIAGTAQTPPRPQTVGVLFPGVLGERRLALIRQGILDVLGDSGNRVAIEVRSAEGSAERLRTMAAELAERRPDLIVAIGSVALRAGRAVAGNIPCVTLDLETDPLASGIAASLSRPGGTTTGIFFDAPEIAGKWLQLLREILPRLQRLGLVYDRHTDLAQYKAAEAAAGALGITAVPAAVGQPSEIGLSFERLAAEKVDAVLVHSSPIFVDNMRSVAELALRHKLPAITLFPLFVTVGGLISYGPDNFLLLRQIGTFAGKVLRGARPADLPIERPSRFTLSVNMRTARALGVEVPQSVLALADDVVE